ncbi:pheromone processing endoprotease [Coemansia sp. RSA 2320]|nr:pheromone processing endoprotease [Coemansia sp. RSA 2320]
MVRSWLAQAAVEPPAVPSVQTDADFEYRAVKFEKTEDADIDVLAARYAEHTGWEHAGQLGQLEAYRVFRQRKSGGRRLLARRHVVAEESLEGVGHVATLQQRKRLYKRESAGPAGFGDRARSGNDTAWRAIGDPLFGRQWHLVNDKETGHDINVTGVWHQGVSGAGVTVALIDDGLDYSSEDLLENFDYRGSYDFNDRTKLPTPRLVEDYHGTRCAGQIAAARNDVCGVGVAYGARVAGIRMLSKEVSDQDEVTALNYAMDTNWIYSCSWGPNDDGATVQGPDRHVEDAFINGVEKGRGGRGSVFVFATGNGGALGDNCNFDGYTNSIYTISIGAIDHQDRHPYYSEQCSAQLAVTYSNGAQRGIVTTDLGVRACTDKHGGTSAAAPLAAGIFALALSVRPELTWREVQHVAVRAAVPVDEADADWADVAEGRRYNHKYGFGKMDAWRIVEAARSLPRVARQTSIVCARDAANVPIPPLATQGGSSTAVVRSADVTRAQAAAMRRTEHVTVTVDMDHDFRGNVEIWLESPHGIRSQLAAVRPHDSSNQGLSNWRFMSVKHWGEDPVGTWSLHVRNAHMPGLKGTLKAWQLTIFGEGLQPESGPESPAPVLSESPPLTLAEPSSVAEPSAPSAELPHSRGLGALAVPALLVIASAVLSALGMLLFMLRRERRRAAMRWTALDALGAPEDAEDADVVELAHAPPHTAGLCPNMENGDSATAHPGSSKGSADSAETARLV